MNCDIQWAAVQNNSFYARMLLMPREGAIIFADLIGKLAAFRRDLIVGADPSCAIVS
jgi:hypothetical protein